jgi:hypothetical protein
MTKRLEQKIETADMIFLRYMACCTLKDQTKYTGILKEVNIFSLKIKL